MITGDRSLAAGKRGAFYNTLEEFYRYWERIDIICPRVKNQEIKEVFGNVYIHSSSWPLLFQAKFVFRKGRELFKKTGFDLITVHEYPPFYNGIGARLLWNKIKVPYVLEIMHIPGFPKSANFKERLYKNLMRWFIKFDSQKAKKVRVINQKQTPEFLVSSGVKKDKIIYMPAFYIDLDIFHPRDEEKKYDIVFAARLEKNKGIFELLKAISSVKVFNPKIRLLIIGSGPLKNELTKYVEQNGLVENVFFSGWLSTFDDVARAYSSARIFVNPSYNEGGPRVVLEAMACGLPVITTRVGLMPDIIQDGLNGLFVDWAAYDMAEKINSLLKDKDSQDKFSKAGLELVKQFEKKEAIKNNAEKLQALI